MKTVIKKSKLIFVSILMSLVAATQAFSAESSFELKAFTSSTSAEQDIAAGLKALYKNKISDAELESQLIESKKFENELYSILNEQIKKQKIMQVRTTEKKMSAGLVNEITIEIDSLIQRPNNHKSNKIIARLYEHRNYKAFCDYKYPTSIMLHHVQDDVGTIEKLAMIQSTGLLGQPALVAVIHMPHYGLRKNGTEELLTADFSAFRKNIMQLILDVHVLKNYLESRSNVDKDNMGLAGISLGAVMGLTVGAFDQSFKRYTFMVGGVDMANILMNRVRNRPDSEVAIALKGAVLEEDNLRKELAIVDSLTWLHKYKNKRFALVSASRDDIVDFKNSVEPMYNMLIAQNNKIDHRVNDDEHSPTGSAWTKLNNVVLPLLKSITKDTKTIADVCPDPIH